MRLSCVLDQPSMCFSLATHLQSAVQVFFERAPTQAMQPISHRGEVANPKSYADIVLNRLVIKSEGAPDGQNVQVFAAWMGGRVGEQRVISTARLEIKQQLRVGSMHCTSHKARDLVNFACVARFSVKLFTSGGPRWCWLSYGGKSKRRRQGEPDCRVVCTEGDEGRDAGVGRKEL
jgi:hypothetical protein